MSKTCIFIDGSNFYHQLKDLAYTAGGKISLLDFDYASFCKKLIGYDEIVEVRYYIGAIKRKRDIKSKKLYADQQRLIAHLQRLGVTIILGQLIQHPDKSYHEKGVDVRIAVEMIRLARQNYYDIAYLFSSDTDLAPAIEEVKLSGKQVVYVGTLKGQSFGLTANSDQTKLFCSKDVQVCLPRISRVPQFIDIMKSCIHFLIPV